MGREQEIWKTEYGWLLARAPDEREQVPYSRQVGIVWRVSENPLICGFDTPHIDCVALVVFEKGKGGVMHISPQTLPEEFGVVGGENTCLGKDGG